MKRTSWYILLYMQCYVRYNRVIGWLAVEYCHTVKSNCWVSATEQIVSTS